jgi:phage tail-like protein
MTATHFLLDTRTGWREEPLLTSGVEHDDGPLRLRPVPGAPQPVTDARGTFGGLADPIGVAAGPDGTVVVLDGGDRILAYDDCAETFAALPCLTGAFALAGARDLAVTRAGDVAVADTGNRRVLVLLGRGLAVRHVETADWEPWGIAASGGGLVVTDRQDGLVHFLDGCGHRLRATDGSGPQLAPLQRPTAVAVDRVGTIYVLQEGAAVVRVIAPDGTGVADVDTLDDRRHDFCAVAVAIDPAGGLCLIGRGGELCVREPQAPWRPLTGPRIDPPLRGLAFTADGALVAVDAQRCCVVRLRNAGGYPKAGRLVAGPLDSRLPRCRWDRVALRADIPVGTSIRVDTLSAEAPLTAAELLAVPAARWATGQLAATTDGGAWDCLVRSGPGRYLWLALTLAGDGADTASIADAEVWFPRRTSIERLPRAFRVGGDGGDFLERYLELLDRQRATVGDRVGTLAELFDGRTAPAGEDGGPDFLGWLAGWMGLAFDQDLPVARRRRLVREAAALYARRGTPDGVARFVSLFCGVEVRVLEHHRLRRWAIAGSGRLGDTTTLFGPEIVRRLQLDEFSSIGSFQLVDEDDPLHDPFLVHAHRFSLLLLAREDERLLARARRVAELAKPAHTEVDVVSVQPLLRVGTQSTVGLDTVVADVPEPGRAGAARLGRGVVVGADPRLGGRRPAQIGTRARVGLDTGLE